MPSGLDYLPYRPAAPETQNDPSKGILGGLNEGLDRLVKENEMRKQLEMKGEYQARDEERRNKASLGMQAAQSASRMQLEQFKAQQKQQEFELTGKILGGTPVDIPQIAEEPKQKPSWTRMGDTQRLQNYMIDVTFPEQKQPALSRMAALNAVGSEEGYRKKYPKDWALLISTSQGQKILSRLPKSSSEGHDRVKLMDVARNPGAFDESVLAELPKDQYSEEVISMIRRTRDSVIKARADTLNRKGVADERKTAIATLRAEAVGMKSEIKIADEEWQKKRDIVDEIDRDQPTSDDFKSGKFKAMLGLDKMDEFRAAIDKWTRERSAAVSSMAAASAELFRKKMLAKKILGDLKSLGLPDAAVGAEGPTAPAAKLPLPPEHLSAIDAELAKRTKSK